MDTYTSWYKKLKILRQRQNHSKESDYCNNYLKYTFVISHHISYLMTDIQPCHLDEITKYHQKQILIWFIPSSHVTVKIL